MTEPRKKLLRMIYDYEQTNGEPLQINADGSDSDHTSYTLKTDVDYLKKSGYVSEPVSLLRSYTLALTEKGEHFVENGFKIPSEAPANNVFHIQNATNSVIGTQANVVMNISTAIQETRKQIDSSNSDDKAELHQIINLLEMITNDQLPAQKGVLSKFSATIQKNSWITSPIMSILLNWLTMLRP